MRASLNRIVFLQETHVESRVTATSSGAGLRRSRTIAPSATRTGGANVIPKVLLFVAFFVGVLYGLIKLLNALYRYSERL